jgi:hypothetical protein
MSSTHGISDSSDLESQTLQSLLGDAIKQYETKVGTSLIENQVAIELGSCDTVESITQILEERAQAFRKFLERDRHPKMIKSIRRAVHVLHTVVTASSVLGGGAAQVGHGAASVVCPNVLVLFVFLIPDPNSIVLPTCQVVIFRNRYPPHSMCLPYFLGACPRDT